MSQPQHLISEPSHRRGPLRRRRRSLAAIIAATAMSTLAACGSSTTTSSSQAKATTTSAFAPSSSQRQAWDSFVASQKGKWKGKTLNIVGEDDPWISAFKQLIPTWEKLTGATINLSVYSYNASYSKEVLLGNAKSSTEDLFIFDTPWVGKFAESHYVDPLNHLISAAPKNLLDYSDFFSVMRRAATWNGNIEGFPFAPYFVLDNYNKTELARAGITKPPSTISQFVADARAVTHKDKGVYGVGMNNASGSAVGQAYFEYIYNMGGRPFESEYPGSKNYYANMTPEFTSPQSLAVVRLFKQLLPYEPPGSLSMEWTQRQADFAAGRVAMVNQWDDTVPSLSDPSQSAVVHSYGVAPDVHESGVPLDTPLGGWTMGINRYSPNKTMAWNFIEWFTSPEVGAEFAHIGGYPARYSVLHDAALVKQYPWYDVLNHVVNTSFPAFRPQIPQSFQIIDTLGTDISQALSGKMSTLAAMKLADRQVASLLSAAGYKVS